METEPYIRRFRMIKKTWQLYFFNELLKLSLLILGSFYLLYVLIDYSAHSKTFNQEILPFYKVLCYYIFQFTKRLDLLLPVALLISSIKVLATANLRGEILALVTGGIPTRRLLTPFLFAAFLATSLCYANYQWIAPKSLNWIDHFEQQYFQSKKDEKNIVYQVWLEDNSVLIYQNYNAADHRFFDVFWIKSLDAIYKMRWLDLSTLRPKGKWVDYFERNEKGELTCKTSLEELELPDIQFKKGNLTAAIYPPKNQPIGELLKSVAQKGDLFKLHTMQRQEAVVATQLYYKLLMPFACVLVVLGPTPFLLRFGRNLSIFWIFAASLTALITFFTMMSSSVILAESQVIPPLIAIAFAPLLYSILITYGLKFVFFQ